mgnify:CR=1 FL=1
MYENKKLGLLFVLPGAAVILALAVIVAWLRPPALAPIEEGRSLLDAFDRGELDAVIVRLEDDRRDGEDLGPHPVADVIGVGVVLAIERQDLAEELAVDRLVVGVEPGDRLILGAGVGAVDLHRAGKIADRLVVQILDVEPDEALVA